MNTTPSVHGDTHSRWSHVKAHGNGQDNGFFLSCSNHDRPQGEPKNGTRSGPDTSCMLGKSECFQTGLQLVVLAPERLVKTLKLHLCLDGTFPVQVGDQLTAASLKVTVVTAD